MASFDSDQDLFADILLQLQVHSALAKEHVQNKKSPLPLLAKSCSLLDNLPSSIKLTEPQSKLLSSLRIDAWGAFAKACVEAHDLIQAEASLQRLSTMQEALIGPLTWRTKQKRSPGHQRPANASTLDQKLDSTTASATATEASTRVASKTLTALVKTPVEATQEQRLMAQDLIKTWEMLRQTYSDMGKQDLANNFTKRIDKLKSRLETSS
ncbi:hypothetical protein BGZ94_000949 [Podila epigama]|nr:hypothetical protein BGZ94_000949 [Podila epigama]